MNDLENQVQELKEFVKQSKKNNDFYIGQLESRLEKAEGALKAIKHEKYCTVCDRNKFIVADALSVLTEGKTK